MARGWTDAMSFGSFRTRRFPLILRWITGILALICFIGVAIGSWLGGIGEEPAGLGTALVDGLTGALFPALLCGLTFIERRSRRYVE